MRTKDLLLPVLLLNVFLVVTTTTLNEDAFTSIESDKNSLTTDTTRTTYLESTCDDANFEDVDGLVVIEAENLVIEDSDWSIKNDFNGYTGEGYLSWDGNNNFNSPGVGIITTEIRINTPGTYRFRWHSSIGAGSNSTEHNDSWLRFPDASDFYAEKNGNRIYPHGSGQTPNPNGSGSDGWFKVYLSGSTTWTWSTQTSDNDAHQIYVTFDTEGVYTMEISGRSKDHLIDRITLSNNATDPLDLENPETPCDGALSINQLDGDTVPSIEVFPNPATSVLYITPKDATAVTQVTIYDTRGSKIITKDIHEDTNEVDISQLSSGVYFLKNSRGESIRFIKQ